MSTKTMKALERAIIIVGSQAELARRCGIKQPYVSNWLRRNKQVPVARAIAIEKATNGLVTRSELRPDIEWD